MDLMSKLCAQFDNCGLHGCAKYTLINLPQYQHCIQYVVDYYCTICNTVFLCRTDSCQSSIYYPVFLCHTDSCQSIIYYPVFLGRTDSCHSTISYTVFLCTSNTFQSIGFYPSKFTSI